MLTKEPKQLVPSQRHVEGGWDHRPPGTNYAQSPEARLGPTLPASQRKSWIPGTVPGSDPHGVTPGVVAAPGNLLEN